MTGLIQASCPQCPSFQRRPTSPRAARAQMTEHNGIYHPEKIDRPAERSMALENA